MSQTYQRFDNVNGSGADQLKQLDAVKERMRHLEAEHTKLEQQRRKELSRNLVSYVATKATESIAVAQESLIAAATYAVLAIDHAGSNTAAAAFGVHHRLCRSQCLIRFNVFFAHQDWYPRHMKVEATEYHGCSSILQCFCCSVAAASRENAMNVLGVAMKVTRILLCKI
jgi:hypothetical protein